MEYDDSYKHAGDRPGTHWGDYEYVDHGHDQLAADPTTSLTDQEIPGLDSLTATEVDRGLLWVRSEVRPALIQLLALTDATATPPTVAGTTPVEAYPRTQPGFSGWLPNAVSQGSAIAMSVADAQMGRGRFLIVSSPQALATVSAPSGTHAIIDAPADLVEAASKINQPPVPEPPTEPVEEPKRSLPSWVLPVVVGGIGLAVIAAVSTIDR